MTPPTTPTPPAQASTDAPTVSDGFLRRRTGLLIPAVLLLAAILLVIGSLAMQVPSTATFPGPQVFPAIVAGVCVVLAGLLAIDVLRRPEPAAVARPTLADSLEASTPANAPHDDHDTRPRANRRALAESLGSVVLFIAALQPVGWLLSGALLFWGVARALGSRRPVFDVFLALSFSSVVQLAFSAGLGLNLPPGLLAGVF